MYDPDIIIALYVADLVRSRNCRRCKCAMLLVKRGKAKRFGLLSVLVLPSWPPHRKAYSNAFVAVCAVAAAAIPI